MNPKYHPLYDQAKMLQDKFHDIAGTSNHPAALAIRQEMRNLEKEMQHQKNPHIIDKHISAIQLEMAQAQNAGLTHLQPNQEREFQNHYEKMRDQLHKYHFYF